ncbi:hypothetical protein QCA50_006714 [Cerrena zonata]|uniref:Uncharacterized protein n=1 Tax=Cerrena zonata TaxID=2478898 RepID=A0AAW0G8T1_9APHY
MLIPRRLDPIPNELLSEALYSRADDIFFLTLADRQINIPDAECNITYTITPIEIVSKRRIPRELIPSLQSKTVTTLSRQHVLIRNELYFTAHNLLPIIANPIRLFAPNTTSQSGQWRFSVE